MDTLQAQLTLHISTREANDSNLAGTTNWRTQCSLMRRLCNRVENIPLDQITYQDLEDWFTNHTFYQQSKVRYPLERFINTLMVQDLMPSLKFNPFGKGDGRTYLKKKPAKGRSRLSKEEFVAIRQSAIANNAQWMVNAMDLAFLLKCRRADIVTLKFKDFNKATKTLSKTISKSVSQKGANKGTTLVWDLKEAYGKDVISIINQARTTRKIQLKDKVEVSPYIIHLKPQREPRAIPEGKTHNTQITQNYLSHEFQRFREMNPEIDANAKKEGRNPPTFHEIRSLAARMDLGKVGLQALSTSLGHSSLEVTEVYLDGIEQQATTHNRLDDLLQNV